ETAASPGGAEEPVAEHSGKGQAVDGSLRQEGIAGRGTGHAPHGLCRLARRHGSAGPARRAAPEPASSNTMTGDHPAGDRPTVLITGSSGFLGQAIARGLIDRYRVIGLDRGEPEHPPAGMNTIELDL